MGAFDPKSIDPGASPTLSVYGDTDASGNFIQAVRFRNLALRVDEASSTVTYIGEADIGTATSTASWRIRKIDTTSGTVITWADSDENFNNVWDDRASLTYG